MLPSVAELTYFVEVTNTLNFTTAAKKLHISQSSLSRAIQRLEQTVGTNLFIRHKKGVTLTFAGKHISKQVKPLLQTWQKTRLDALASHDDIVGTVNIGYYSAIGMFLHNMLANLLEHHPKLNVTLQNHNTTDTIQDVIDSNLDISILINPAQHPELVIHTLKQLHTTFWVGQGNRDIQDPLSSKGVILYSPPMHEQALLKICESVNMTINRLMKIDSVEVLANMATNDCGIAVLPACYVNALFSEQLKPLPDAPVVISDLCLVYRQESTNVKAVLTILNTLKLLVTANECLQSQSKSASTP